MRRRTALGGVAVVAAGAAGLDGNDRRTARAATTGAGPLRPPAQGPIRVAVLLSHGATVIDFAGPWEVFQDVPAAAGDRGRPFELYTVAETPEAVECSAGMRIVPNATLGSAPAPHVVVVGAQHGRTPAIAEWLRAMVKSADVVMSVCTGAFQLGAAGLLDGLDVTTHHDFYDRLQQEVPRARVRRGLRFVEGPVISTAGGLTSGIDLALRVVERYHGRERAQRTADYMEYTSAGWKI